MTKLGTIRKIISSVNDAAWAATCLTGLTVVIMDIIAFVRKNP